MTHRSLSIMLTIELRMGYHILSMHSNLFLVSLLGTTTNHISLKYGCLIKISN